MKLLLTISAIVLCSMNLLFSQAVNLVPESNENDKIEKGIFPFSVGPYLGVKGGVATNDTPDGIKNEFNFNGLPDFGASFYIPFGGKSNLGAILDIGYLTYTFKNKFYFKQDMKWTYVFNYLNISPRFYLSGLVLGFNLGIPMNIRIDDAPVTNVFTPRPQTDMTKLKDNMALSVDVHLGGMIPLMFDETGRLNLFIVAEYCLTGLMKNDRDLYPGGNIAYNPNPAAIKLGFNYLFNLTK